VHWTAAPDALPTLPSWALPTRSMTWAPAAERTGSGWVLFFSTEARSSHLECIGAATAGHDNPAGPYVDRSRSPLVCQTRLGGSIDPSVVHGPDGHTYLVWKNDGNGHGVTDTLWSAPLAADGLSLEGPPDALLSATDTWDDGVVEAPAMIAATGGGWWLYYAAGGWDTDSYATGLAYCPSIEGPCLPTSTRPYLSTTPSMVSPGGLDTVTAHDGQLWAAWTALQPVQVPWDRGRTWYDRVLDIAPILRH
jgi:arabinan endo-1,5-alpha-L-arabinosidase